MLALPAELTQSQATACVRHLLEQLHQAGGSAVVDAGELQRFDSSALAVLLELRRAALAQNTALSFGRLPGRLRDLAHLYGVAGLLDETA